MPGKIIKRDISQSIFSHYCSTLPGKSGSAAIDISKGKPLHIHYEKQDCTEYYAISVQKISSKLRGDFPFTFTLFI